jgi:hypothetical protein
MASGDGRRVRRWFWICSVSPDDERGDQPVEQEHTDGGGVAFYGANGGTADHDRISEYRVFFISQGAYDTDEP